MQDFFKDYAWVLQITDGDSSEDSFLIEGKLINGDFRKVNSITQTEFDCLLLSESGEVLEERKAVQPFFRTFGLSVGVLELFLSPHPSSYCKDLTTRSKLFLVPK